MDQGEPNAQRQKPNVETAAAVDVDAPNVAAPTVEQTGEIFKLDIGLGDRLWRKTFNFLTLPDLVSVCKTCKLTHKIFEYCFQKNYSGRVLLWSSGGPFADLHREIVNHFAPFIQTIEIREQLEDFEWFLNRLSKCSSLKHIELTKVPISKTDVHRLKDTMSELEVLLLILCELNKNDQDIIDGCTKLKRLAISNCGGLEYNWFNRIYPTMEYFKFVSCEIEPIDGLAMFLQSNPNIRKFATDTVCLWENRDAMMAANIKLDELAIIARAEYEFVSVCGLLNELHKHGFYKRLQFYIQWLNQESIDQLAMVNGLVKLNFRYYSSNDHPIALSALKSVEEISATLPAMISDLSVLANELEVITNLERIYFRYATIDVIIPFIRQSFKLQKIKIDMIKGGMHFNEDTGIIDLLALQKERERLPNAEKITLYVADYIYVLTKGAMGTDFGLIKLKRKESFEWDHDF